MHNIAEATAGTFSFVKDHAAVQDALAQCIGGLRSVTAQGAWIEVETWFPSVRVMAVKSGRYESTIKEVAHCCSVHEATVSVGELYADEERLFLLLLDVPSLDDAGAIVTLMKVRCTYLDMATRQILDVDFTEACAEVLRSPDKATDVARCVEVERELLRVAAAEDMTLAREAAERGAYDEAARILDARRESLSRSAPALSGDDAMCKAVATELHELSQRVSDERDTAGVQEDGQRVHSRQHELARAAARLLGSALSPLAAGTEFGCVGSSVFATPAMRKMEKLSEMLRRQQEARPPPLPENGSKSVPPRSRLEAKVGVGCPSSQHVEQIPTSSTQALSKIRIPRARYIGSVWFAWPEIQTRPAQGCSRQAKATCLVRHQSCPGWATIVFGSLCTSRPALAKTWSPVFGCLRSCRYEHRFFDSVHVTSLPVEAPINTAPDSSHPSSAFTHLQSQRLALPRRPRPLHQRELPRMLRWVRPAEGTTLLQGWLADGAAVPLPRLVRHRLAPPLMAILAVTLPAPVAPPAAPEEETQMAPW
jgi:hypothetical protein